ncbi:MAG: hypothetical protein ABI876_01310 [Bacteroidota bacterium]
MHQSLLRFLLLRFLPILILAIHFAGTSAAFAQNGGDEKEDHPSPQQLCTARIVSYYSGPHCYGDVVTLAASYGMAYRWSPGGQTTSVITVTETGLYSVTVTNSDGCIATSPEALVKFLPKPPPPTIQVFPRLILCEGDSVILKAMIPDGVIGAKIQWSTFAITESLIVRTSGRFSVTLTYGNGCVARSDTIKVEFRKRPDAIIIGPLTACSNDLSRFRTPDFHLPDVITRWKVRGSGKILNRDDSLSIDVAWKSSGIDTVGLELIDTVSGCVATLDRTVTVIAAPNLAFDSTGVIEFCDGDSTRLDGGEGFAGYLWSDGSTKRYLPVKKSGFYFVDVQRDDGGTCRSNTVEVRVRGLPTPTITGPPRVCRDQLVSYRTEAIPGGVYSWSATGGLIVSGQGTDSITVRWWIFNSGQVGLRVRAGSFCETAAVPYNQEIFSRASLQPSGTVELCDGQSTVLDAGNGFTRYRWSTGDTSRLLKITRPGDYWADVEITGICSFRSDTVHVNIHTPPKPVINPAGPITILDNGSVTLDAGGPYAAYLWSDGSTTRQLVVKGSGIYTVLVADGFGCGGISDSVIVVMVSKNPDSAFALVELPAVVASPGERISVPLHLIAPRNEILTMPSSFIGRLRFNRTMLMPAGATPRGVIDGDDRVIEISGNLPPGIVSTDLLLLDFIATLGDARFTRLRLESFVWEDSTLKTIMLDGEFYLSGICITNGDRLIRGTRDVMLKPIRPNPASEQAEVEYEVIESGGTQLYIADLFGRPVRRLLDGGVAPGRHVGEIDLSEIPSGVFFLVLRTPSESRCVPIEIRR